MTHQNHQTNGASLEDCHTNFFALTELFGIKWRKLVWGESNGTGGDVEGAAPLADPVISSYARLLAGDILCVWRRVPTQPSIQDIYEMVPTPPAPPPLSLRSSKELWIFWYGEEPDLSGMVAPELMATQGEQGSWDSGLSYECRSLLFKALHNLIERCLLSRDFVRLGKWFVQPYDGDEEDVEKSPWHLSFSFAFFLHGESTVCASVDVRQHPPVRTLTAKRLARVARLAPTDNAEPHADAKVILAPFGLEASVTGREWSESDAATSRLLDAWRQLYPLEQGCGATEVVSGGVRMRYPSSYVLSASLDTPRDADPPQSLMAARTTERTMRALAHTQPHRAIDPCSEASDAVKAEGDFLDPTRKTPCTCAKCRRVRRAKPPLFHRRSHTQSNKTPPPPGTGVACSPASMCAGSPAQPVSAPPSAGTQPVSPALNTQQHSAAHTNIAHAQSTSCVPTTMHTPAPTPDPLAPPTPAPPQRNYPQGGESPLGGETTETSQSDTLKRPAVPPTLPPGEKRPDPLEDEAYLRMLYDYTSVHAWLEHPVKRFKSDSVCWRELTGSTLTTEDLYMGQEQHNGVSNNTTTDTPMVTVKQEKTDVDDIKEYKNLFTSDGLCPTLKDLDQIFDNSDDAASGDETLQVQTPPDSNKSSEEARCSGNAGGRSVRPEELSKMFPTPPSMEAHAQPSPGFTLVDDTTHALQPLRHHPPAGSPQPDPIEDWSYVFKPPTVSKYVGSSKYAPLTSLPSQLLPPLPLPCNAIYKPHHSPNQPHSHPRPTQSAPTPSHNPPAAPTPVAPSAPVSRSPPPAAPSPRACPVLLNVLLADTVLNLFRDHNFDSCTLCVCSAEPDAVGNIRGADATTYLPPPDEGSPGDDDYVRCSCGFSAVLNRRLAHDAGLFYEDEMEITGASSDPALKGGSGGDGGALRDVAEAVLQQACAPGGAASALCRAAARELQRDAQAERGPELLEFLDGEDSAARAMRAACVARPPAKPRLHRWPFASARGPRSSRDVVRLMRRLRPLLQDATQKRCCGARMWDGVSGPLTWRQFHRLAGRGNEDLCEPQPVPPVLVGHERDWLALSPYALRHWERLGLEPYSYARDVAYVALAPADAALTRPLQTFFRELSAAYETCRLGRHAPLTRVAPDGLLRACATPTGNNTTDEWLPELPSGALGDSIRSYSEKLRTKLVPQLAGFTLDHTVFESDKQSGLSHMDRPAPSPMRPPSTPDHPPTPNSQSDQENESPTSNNTVNGSQNSGLGGVNLGGGNWETEERGAPLLVIYIVEPPGAHTQPAPTLHALLRLATKLTNHMHQHKPLVKIISLEGVWATSGVGGGVWAGELRALAFSVFSGARRLLTHTANGKSLTGFGTAANASLMLKAKDEKNRAPYKLYSPAYVLAPTRTLKDAGDNWAGASGGECAVLFLAYCLSHDQRWLLAAATDARGELLDTAVIDVHVPARARRRQTPARRLGLTKLMDFSLGVMSQSAQPWRLVVGRVGRIGHGELKGWSWLLSRKNLTRASGVLREICGSCTVLYPGGAPCILSACLVSTEPDSRLRLMADRFTPDERFSQASIASHLHTPRDVTATHILVFPTSATTQSNQMPFEQPMANGEDNDMMFLGVDMAAEDMGEDNISDLLIGDDNIFNNMTMWSANSPRRHDDDVPSPQREQHHNPAYAHGDNASSEQVGLVLQQPLALGYLVSTAPLGGMPGWWWGSSGHLRDACPAFLKTALHVHAGTADDYSSLTTAHHAHPLDSSITTDVLRHVLEGYNALSWLALDGTSHDRASCLPLHVQALMRLYHSAAALA